MHAAVAIFEGMDEDETERQQGGGYDRIDGVGKHTPTQARETPHEASDIFRLWADQVDDFAKGSSGLADVALNVTPVLSGIARVDNLVLQGNQSCFVGQIEFRCIHESGH